MNAIRYEKDPQGIVTLTLDMPGQATNTLTEAFCAAYEAAVARLEAERDAVTGVIVTSAKPTFFAGSDLEALRAAQPSDAAALFERSMATKAAMRRLETFGRPVVAAIEGAALGPGFELCLACHARFVLDDGGIALGLPEATLGLLPGLGGVVRLVRRLGVEAALPYLADGTTVAPAEALVLALVDGLAPDRAALREQARAWIHAHADARQPWDRPDFRVPGATASAAAPLSFLRTAPVLRLKKDRGLYPAPEAALSAAVEGAGVDFETASRIESRYFVHLATHPVTRNLITTFFFQMNEIVGGAGRPAGVPAARFKRIGIVGAGMMGAGIAQVAAAADLSVVLKDVTSAAAEAGKARVAKALARQVEKGRLSADRMTRTLGSIVPTGDTAELNGCELIVEAVFERRELKLQVIREAEPQLAPGGIFASNTSTLPIGGLARASARPAGFVGLHFFSPVDRMALVEVVRGRDTSPETLARALDFVRQIGKLPIVVHDSRGFYTSRVFGTFTKEGAAMLGEGVDASTIENAALSTGMPVGPLAAMDETSMALQMAVREQAIADLEAEGLPVPQHPGWTVIETMARRLGRPGRAAGGGFYDYPEGGRKHLWPDLSTYFPRRAEPFLFADLCDRLLYIQALESVRCIEEGVIDTARDANVGSVLGIGFPRWTGGALQYVDSIGLPAFTTRAEALALRYGARFEPPALLRRMARSGERFV